MATSPAPVQRLRLQAACTQLENHVIEARSIARARIGHSRRKRTQRFRIMDAVHTLLRRGLITEEQLTEARRGAASGPGRPLHVVLCEMGAVDEVAALEALAEDFGMEFMDLTRVEIDPAVLGVVPAKVIYRQRVFPVARVNGTIQIGRAHV